MAEQHLLDILKQGVEKWNQWRKKNGELQPSLFRIDLSGADLRKIDLRRVDLSGVDLSGTNLSGTNLTRADLSETDLSKADLTNTFLYYTNFNEAKLDEVNFNNARMARTIFGDVDLSKAKGLETVRHEAPLIIGIDTIYRSKGNIPEIFLQGAGVPDSFISYLHLLVRHPIDYYSCFISYSNKDQAFAERLYTDLQGKGVRCWFAPENIRVGDKIRSSIDESIRLYDKLLLIVSQHSMTSQWVQREVEIALKKERKEEQTVLFPIRLDDSIMTATAGWATSIRNTKHIADFRHWTDHDEYQKALSRLIRDLKITIATESNVRESGDEK